MPSNTSRDETIKQFKALNKTIVSDLRALIQFFRVMPQHLAMRTLKGGYGMSGSDLLPIFQFNLETLLCLIPKNCADETNLGILVHEFLSILANKFPALKVIDINAAIHPSFASLLLDHFPELHSFGAKTDVANFSPELRERIYIRRKPVLALSRLCHFGWVHPLVSQYPPLSTLCFNPDEENEEKEEVLPTNQISSHDLMHLCFFLALSGDPLIPSLIAEYLGVPPRRHGEEDPSPRWNLTDFPRELFLKQKLKPKRKRIEELPDNENTESTQKIQKIDSFKNG